jgi:hypothetical protein
VLVLLWVHVDPAPEDNLIASGQSNGKYYPHEVAQALYRYQYLAAGDALRSFTGRQVTDRIRQLKPEVVPVAIGIEQEPTA